MDTLRLISIQNNKVYYTDHTQSVQVADLYTLPERDLILHFTHEDQEIITHTAIHDGYSIARLNTGEPLLVPNKRQDYIFFFVAVFTLSIIMTIFTCIRHIQIDNITLYGSFLFFPLAFACTDIINELYGYNRVRIIINTTSLALIIMGVLMYFTLIFKGQSIHSGNDALMLDIFSNIPTLIILTALALLIADSLNAYIFHKIRGYLKGKGLWLRSLISTCIANFFHSTTLMILLILVGSLDVPFERLFELMCSGHLAKMLYALCSLPLIYGAVYFVKQKEHEHALTYAHNWQSHTAKSLVS